MRDIEDLEEGARRAVRELPQTVAMVVNAVGYTQEEAGGVVDHALYGSKASLEGLSYLSEGGDRSVRLGDVLKSVLLERA